MTPESPLAIVLALAVAALLPVLHYLFWTWWLRVPGGEDELLFAETRDGWRIALARRRPRGPARLPPVLLCHGIAVNRQTLDFGLERYSLSAFLSRAGFDCFAIDLRGHGDSRRPRGAARRWNLDTYLREDIPAALDLVRARTGSEQVLWVGHSQGALLGMAACALYPDRVKALVQLAGPVHFRAQQRIHQLVALRWLPLGHLLKIASRMVAPWSGFWHPSVAQLAVNSRNMERRIYRRMLANAMENLQPGVLDHFALFIREDTFRTWEGGDGAVDYRAASERATQPGLFVSAEKDGFAPPEVVLDAFHHWGGEPKRYWESGRDYGHVDLLLGRNAPEVVYPVVRDFLLEVSAAAQEVGVSAPPERNRPSESAGV
jgi:pimeloyl-ACP methyl ester carboxylesterase